MKNHDVSANFASIRRLLLQQVPPLQVLKDRQDLVELAGTRAAILGKRSVPYVSFASLMLKEKVARFHFYLIYMSNAFIRLHRP